jgi:hypothetical protein
MLDFRGIINDKNLEILPIQLFDRFKAFDSVSGIIKLEDNDGNLGR